MFIADRHSYERAGSIKPFKQVGGDASSREGWRIALQLIRECFGDSSSEICERLNICQPDVFRVQSVMADKGINTVTSTSCGRLFDAVSAVLGVRRESTFEGEASTALMFTAQRYIRSCNAPLTFCTAVYQENGRVVLDTLSVFKDIVTRFLDGEDKGALAYLFHAALADEIAQCGDVLRRKHGLETVALSGGVFQNKLLLKLSKDKLEENGFNVLIHSLVPPNDGGIALGQAYYSV